MTGRHSLGQIGRQARMLHDIDVLDREMTEVAEKLAHQEAAYALESQPDDEKRAPRREAEGA